MDRIGLVYAKAANQQLAGMDLIRWTRIGRQLQGFGFEVDLITDQPAGVSSLVGLPVVNASDADWEHYRAVKACYQRSIDIIPDHPNLIVRMCRVVDEKKPRRDSASRAEILRQQRRIAATAAIVAFNDELNARRWRRFYGNRQEVLLVPGASPERIPKPHTNPFHPGRRIVLFCGSLTSPRFPGVINSVATALAKIDPSIQVHVIGRNRLHLYGGSPEPLDTQVLRVHDPVDENECWQYILHADVGLALAPSDDEFEGELTKIYYYLRGGLPVVTESTAANRALVESTGHGAVVDYGDIPDMVDKIVSALELPKHDNDVMRFMVQNHSWRRRASVYVEALGRRARSMARRSEWSHGTGS